MWTIFRCNCRTGVCGNACLASDSSSPMTSTLPYTVKKLSEWNTNFDHNHEPKISTQNTETHNQKTKLAKQKKDKEGNLPKERHIPTNVNVNRCASAVFLVMLVVDCNATCLLQNVIYQTIICKNI